MTKQEDADQNSGSYTTGKLQSPFIDEELFAEGNYEEWTIGLNTLEAESPFSQDFFSWASLTTEPVDTAAEQPWDEAETIDADEELDADEEVAFENLAWGDGITPPIFGEADLDHESEYIAEEFEADNDEELAEEILTELPSGEYYDAFLDDDETEPEFQDAPQLFSDVELPVFEEEMENSNELPTDPADGWVVPQEILRAGEVQYVRYDNAPNWDETKKDSICAKQLSAGAQILQRFLLGKFSKIKRILGLVCRPNTAKKTKLSIHGTGRALDIVIPPIDGKANSVIGDPIANWLVFNASAIGIQYLIWNRVRWSGMRRNNKFARYTGPRPHHDHIHVELNLDGARRKTPWFFDKTVSTVTKKVDSGKTTTLNAIKKPATTKNTSKSPRLILKRTGEEFEGSCPPKFTHSQIKQFKTVCKNGKLYYWNTTVAGDEANKRLVKGYRSKLIVEMPDGVSHEFDAIERANGFAHLKEGAYQAICGHRKGHEKAEEIIVQGNIVIHIANYPHQLHGCVAPGKKVPLGVLDSGITLTEINKLLGWEPGKKIEVVVKGYKNTAG